MNPYVFVFGCPRSGTTVIHRILDLNPTLCMLRGENMWIARYLERTREEKTTDEMSVDVFLRLMEEQTPVWMKQSESQIEQILTERIPFRDFISRLFDLYSKTQGKEKVGNKNPRIALFLSRMSELWPWARFVHIIRDGRDVCLSLNSWRRLPQIKKRFPDWDKNPALFSALWWKWRVLLGRQAESILGPTRYYEIRYEALVQNPSEESAKLCQFLSLPYDDNMIRFHEGRTKEEGRDAKGKWLPITTGLRDWRNQMTSENLENFEVAAGDLLQTLGYARACRSFSPEKLKEARRISQLFNL